MPAPSTSRGRHGSLHYTEAGSEVQVRWRQIPAGAVYPRHIPLVLRGTYTAAATTTTITTAAAAPKSMLTYNARFHRPEEESARL